MYILQRTDRDQRISLHRCSYSLDPTTDNLHDFVNGTGQDTNAANKLPQLSAQPEHSRLEAGREKLRAVQASREAPEVSAE